MQSRNRKQSGHCHSSVRRSLRSDGDFHRAHVAGEVKTYGTPIAAADCVVSEDSKEGIRGARRAGMKFLAVTNSHPAEPLNDADAVVKSLEGVNLIFFQNMCP